MLRKSKLMLAIALAAAASNTIAPSAHAFGMMDLLVSGRLRYVGIPRTPFDWAATGVCIMFLPLCILGDNAQSGSFSAEQLKANGYSDQEIAKIIEGQAALMTELAATNKAITVEGSMSAEDIAQYASSVQGVTPEYVQFIRSNF